MTRATSLDPDDHPFARAPRELDSRVGDGIHVQLLWHPDDDHLSVAVDDAKTGETFELAVCHGQCALDVFHHPYAYTASSSPASSRRRSLTTSSGLNHELGSST